MSGLSNVQKGLTLLTPPLGLSFLNGGSFVNSSFVFTVKTDNTGTSNNDQFTMPTVSDGSYNCNVDWGDGTDDDITTYNDAAWTHTFTGGAGTYTVKIFGTFTGLKFNDGGDKSKLTNISQWGIFNSGNEINIFFGCDNLTITATDNKDLTGVTTMSTWFKNCTSLTTIPSIASWDWTNISSINNTWNGCTSFNQDLSGITLVAAQASNSFKFTFYDCSSLNSPIFSIPSGVTDVTSFLNRCTSFDQDLSSWNVVSLTNATNMFIDSGLSTTNYNLLLSSWSQQSLQSGVPFHGGSAKWEFGFGGQGRFDMISIYSWTITDGGQEDATMGAWYNPHNVLKSTANPADGTGVTTWSDLSDNANDATEATNPPLFKTNIANGEPMLLFDGSDSRLDIAADASLDGLFDGGGFFICAVKPLSDGEGGQGRIFSQSGANTHISLRNESSGACKLRLFKKFSTTSGIWQTENLDIIIDEVNIIAVDYDSSNAANDPVFYINSTTPVSLTETITPVGSSSALGGIQIGNALFSATTFDGYIGDLGFFKSSPSSTVRNEMINYLATKFGVTLS